MRRGVVLAAEGRELRHGHVEVLLPMIDRVIAEAGLIPGELEAVAVATGPGGFTGIRVGLAAAHGISLAANAALVGVTSFAAVVAGLAPAAGTADRAVLVALDSRRADLYVQLFAPDRSGPLAAAVSILPEDLGGYVADLAGGAPLLAAGDAAAAAVKALEGRDVVLAADSAPDALGVAAAALRRLQSGSPSEPVRPFYLRPPDVTLPRRREPASDGPCRKR